MKAPTISPIKYVKSRKRSNYKNKLSTKATICNTGSGRTTAANAIVSPSSSASLRSNSPCTINYDFSKSKILSQSENIVNNHLLQKQTLFLPTAYDDVVVEKIIEYDIRDAAKILLDLSHQVKTPGKEVIEENIFHLEESINNQNDQKQESPSTTSSSLSSEPLNNQQANSIYSLDFCQEIETNKDVDKRKEEEMESSLAENIKLSTPQDVDYLNSLHCFLRENLIEIFSLDKTYYVPTGRKNKNFGNNSKNQKCIAMQEDNNFNGEFLNYSGEKKYQSPKKTCSAIRVGLQCVFCSHLPKKERISMSEIYPKRLSDIYRAVCTWQRIHFQQCPFVPSHTRDTYWKFKAEDRTRGKTRFWQISAYEIGLRDSRDIFNFKEDNEDDDDETKRKGDGIYLLC